MLRYGVKDENSFARSKGNYMVVDALLHACDHVISRVLGWRRGRSGVPPDQFLVVPGSDYCTVASIILIPHDRFDCTFMTPNISRLAPILKIKQSKSFFLAPSSYQVLRRRDVDCSNNVVMGKCLKSNSGVRVPEFATVSEINNWLEFSKGVSTLWNLR